MTDSIYPSGESPLRKRSRVPWVLLAALFGGVWSAACADALTFGFPGAGLVTWGDTIEARLDSPTDVDVYEMERDGGFVVNLFVQALDPGSEGHVVAIVRRNKVSDSGFAASLAGDTALYDDGSGLIAVDANGDFQIRVQSILGGYVGRYLLHPRILNDAPESGTAELTLDQTLEERIDPPGDTDVFTLQASDGSEVNAFFEVWDAKADTSLVLTFGTGTNQAMRLSAGAADGTPRLAVSGRFLLQGSGEFSVQVSGADSKKAVGNYRLLFAKIDRAPEGASEVVTLRDTVSGAIEPIGDIDEFSLGADTLGAYRTFFRSLSASPSDTLVLEIRDPPGITSIVLTSVGGDPDLRMHATRMMGLSSAATVTVTGKNSVDDSGPYEFQVYSIDTAPEDGGETLVIGDSIVESIDPLGDIDRFLFTGAGGDLINVTLQFTDAPVLTEFTLREVATNELVENWRRSIYSGQEWATGRVTLPRDGDYRIHILAEDSRGLIYTLRIFAIDTLPELAPQTLVFGVTANEPIWPPDDVDILTFAGTAGETVAIHFETLNDPGGRGHELGVVDPSGRAVRELSVNSLTASGDGGTVLSETGTYRVFVKPRTSAPSDTSSYSILLRSTGQDPETIGIAVATGSVISGEAIDLIADIDTFAFSAAAGDELVAIFQTDVPCVVDCASPVSFDIIDPATASVLRGTVSSSVPSYTRKIALPRTDTYTVRINGGSQTTFVGPYRFELVIIDHAPETVGAAYTIGDSLSGERLDPIGDVDEYSFNGTAGVEYGLVGQTGTADLNGVVINRLLRPATGDTLVYRWTKGLDTGFDWSAGPFMLPATETYLMELDSDADSSIERGYQGPYGFRIYPINRAPETVLPGVAVGDTILGEAIDVFHDIDEFQFTGVAGQEVEFILQRLNAASNQELKMEVVDETAIQFVAVLSSFDLSERTTGRLVLSSNGIYTVRISSFVRRYIGPYQVSILP